MNKPMAAFAASIFMVLGFPANASESSHPEFSVSLARTQTDRHIDPTYTTGDPDTFNSFGVSVSRQLQSNVYWGIDALGSYSNESGTELGIVDLKLGFEFPFSTSGRWSFSPRLGVDQNFIRIASEYPPKTNYETGFYLGMETVFEILPRKLNIFAHYSKSSLDDSGIAGAGLGYWIDQKTRLRLGYSDEGWLQRIKGTISFIF